MRTPSGQLLVLGLLWVGFTACVRVGPHQEEPWRLLTLSPIPAPAVQDAESSSSRGPVPGAIGVGPIHLPGYLDQDQLVTRVSQSRVTLSENDRWAEPLEDNMAQVLAHNLSMLLRTDQIILYPWPSRERPAYQVEVDVLSFEPDTAGTAHLAARWLLRDLASRQTIAEKEVRLTNSAAGGSPEQAVASLSRALGQFSEEIAKVIREPGTLPGSTGL